MSGGAEDVKPRKQDSRFTVGLRSRKQVFPTKNQEHQLVRL